MQDTVRETPPRGVSAEKPKHPAPDSISCVPVPATAVALHKLPLTKLPLFFMGMVMGSQALIDHAEFSARPDDEDVKAARLRRRVAADALFVVFALAFLCLQLPSFLAFWVKMGWWIRLYVREGAHAFDTR